MAIRSVEAYALREPKSGRAYSLLQVKDSSGQSGWGEAIRLEPAALALVQQVLQGQEPTRYDVLTNQLAGNVLSGAVNMALLDLCGKIAKAPVFQVLGGPTRNKVRALTGYHERAIEQGHKAFVVPVALPKEITARPRFVASVVEHFEGLRKRHGEGIDFVADGMGLLPSLEACDIAAALETLHPLWFDQPCRAPNADILARMTTESATPIGLGRDLDQTGPLQNMLRDGVIDVVRLPVSRLGITSIRRAAALAETYYVAVAPFHQSGGPIATAAAIQLAASLPNFFIQQMPLVLEPEDRRMRDELVGGPIEAVKDGYFSLSLKPGLGIEVDEAVVRRYAQ